MGWADFWQLSSFTLTGKKEGLTLKAKVMVSHTNRPTLTTTRQFIVSCRLDMSVERSCCFWVLKGFILSKTPNMITAINARRWHKWKSVIMAANKYVSFFHTWGPSIKCVRSQEGGRGQANEYEKVRGRGGSGKKVRTLLCLLCHQFYLTLLIFKNWTEIAVIRFWCFYISVV